ncbi:unnamed protein product [Microthlaspi erraticum]|uniref:J domain-containing protein n=1 Tax=Microthlaspi erraticum TaxID=1685480 RepID=A0A6D2J1G3_9BRAS|nr:unnamed protein product [Microthlaspi erraticum]
MEYTKDEAVWAREIAEMKFLANDLIGAKEFAMKAQSMYPELEGIDQMVATFNVHVSAKKITHGEPDYYGVLGVSPEADDETLRKTYKKLAVLIHPDVNKTVGAEEAFMFLAEALLVFSEKGKRAEYDLKRHIGRGASSSSSPNDAAERVVNTATIIRVSEASASAAAAVARKTTAGGGATFWTGCVTCKTQYEYHRIYITQKLLCPYCSEPFKAVQTDPPGSSSIRKAFNELEFDSFRLGTSTPTHAPPQTGAPKDKVVPRVFNKRAVDVSLSNASKRTKVMENGVAGVFASTSNTVRYVSEEDIKTLLAKRVKPLISTKLQKAEVNAIKAEVDAMLAWHAVNNQPIRNQTSKIEALCN